MALRREYPDATLLRADGTEFSGTTIVKNLVPKYARNYPEITVLANNARAFSVMGDDQDWIDSFQLDCFRHAAVAQIKGNLANELTHGIFTLLIPDLASAMVDRHLIRFFEAAFTPQSPRNSVEQIFQAQITEIEVIRSDQVTGPL